MMARLKPALISEEGKFIKVPEADDKLDASFVPVSAPLQISSAGILELDMTAISDGSAAVVAHNAAPDAHSVILANKASKTEVTAVVAVHNSALDAHATIISELVGKPELTAHDVNVDAHSAAMALKVNVADINRAQAVLALGDNFNDYKTPGLLAVNAGVYINQPPVTSNGVDLKSGFLRVSAGPDGDVFQEFLVWQAGGSTGMVLSRGWHKAIDSWGSWISAAQVMDIDTIVSEHNIDSLAHVDIRDLVSVHNISSLSHTDIRDLVFAHNTNLDAHAALFGSKIRNRYTATVTIYVRPDGNDSNSGLVDTAAGALKTLSGVLTWLRKTDMSGYAVTVILAPGTYTGAWWSGLGINCTTTLKSADSTDKAIISTAMTCIDYAYVNFQNIKFQNTSVVDIHSTSFISGCDFEYQGANTGNIITTQRNSYLYLQTGCSLSGTAGVGIYVTQNSMVNNWGELVFKDPIFSDAVVSAIRSSLVWSGATFTGSATGRRFNVSRVSLIDSNNRGPNAIPGTIDGTADAATGGFYI